MFLLHFHLKEFYFENLLKGNENEVFRDNLETKQKRLNEELWSTIQKL